MGFENIEDSINFCLLTIIILFGVSMLILIPNYMNIPVRWSVDFLENNPDYVQGFDYSYYYEENNPDFWRIDLGADRKITEIENIIILIPMFWGFLRLIDLERKLHKFKNE